MTELLVYQFTMYDIRSDNYTTSRRWGTPAGIKCVGGVLLPDTAVHVDESILGREIAGLSEIGFDPHATQGFPRQVKV